jgi:Zn-dependent peptidase ImmA (M78 family)
MDKYKEDPEAVAKFLVTVNKNNYLAHTIREIGRFIYGELGKNYHIVTQVSPTLKNDSKTVFHNRGCIIYLPFDCEESDDRSIRLILAHELGHLVYNVDRLNDFNFVGPRKAPVEEELFAWQFAYYLVKMKGDELRRDIERKRFIYADDDLKRSLFSTVRKNMPEVYDDIKNIFR